MFTKLCTAAWRARGANSGGLPAGKQCRPSVVAYVVSLSPNRSIMMITSTAATVAAIGSPRCHQRWLRSVTAHQDADEHAFFTKQLRYEQIRRVWPFTGVTGLSRESRTAAARGGAALAAPRAAEQAGAPGWQLFNQANATTGTNVLGGGGVALLPS